MRDWRHFPESAREVKLMRLTILRKSVYALMAAMLFASPVLACSLPGLTMSEAEMECCQRMADHCGGAHMDESHSCCAKAPDPGTVQKAAAKYSPTIDMLVLGLPVAQPAHSASLNTPVIDALEFSESPPGQNSILRI